MADTFACDGSREISYQIRYVEEHYRKSSNPFSFRQTGIYHRHSANEELDVFIVVHPVEDSLLEEEVVRILRSKETALDFCKNPFRLHFSPFIMYIDNWRWYLRFIGEQLGHKVSNWWT